jgi:DNA-binding LacI/PurR family transcriptional regulator
VKARGGTVTIADVARVAGVSSSTVSYVLTGKRSISRDTAARVQAAIIKLGYRPHAGARALAGAGTNVLALVVPLRSDENVPVIMEIVAAVVTKARTYGQDVLLVTKDEGVAGLHRVAGSAMVDALIITDVEADDPRVAALRHLAQPSVLIGVPDRPAGVSCVDLDFAAAGALTVDELADRGHIHLALLGPPPSVYERRTSYALRFLAGLEQARGRRGVRITAVGSERTPDGVRRALTEVLTRDPEVTGLVVHNEGTLPFVAPALAELGRRVPEDVSIIAVCPDDMAVTHEVAYSNVRVPAQELGEIAVEMVMRQLAGNTTVETRLLAPSLTDRASLAGAPSG